MFDYASGHMTGASHDVSAFFHQSPEGTRDRGNE